jgi:hypothetical protein
MPETKKGKKILAAMQRTYGEKGGRSVFYGAINKGTIHGTGTQTERRRKSKHSR